MAVEQLVLNEPKKITLPSSAGDLRKVVIPVGARYVEYRSAQALYYETDHGQGDGNAGTPGRQQGIDAGTGSFRCPGSGAGLARTRSVVNLYLAGDVADQEVWLTATSRAP